jgi:hypothetical protein
MGSLAHIGEAHASASVFYSAVAATLHRMPAPEIAQECRAQNRTKKRIFGYGFGYGSLDMKNVYLGTKNVSLDAKNGSFDMAISFWIWPLVVFGARRKY